MELETLNNRNDIENIIIISDIPMQYDIIGRYFVEIWFDNNSVVLYQTSSKAYIDYKIM